MPRNEDDFMIGASKNHLIHLENLSEPIRPWASDLLCPHRRGRRTPQAIALHDQDEVRLNATRPVVITSIPRVVWKPDALDRSIRFVLPEWDGERKSTKADRSRVDQRAPTHYRLALQSLNRLLKNGTQRRI